MYFRYLFCSFCLCIVLSELSAAPRLPAVSLSDGPSSAKFSGGASSDSGLSFRSAFDAFEIITVNVEISVAPEDTGKLGSIYILGTLDGVYYQQLNNGSWTPWSGTLQTLQAFDGPRSLFGTETVNVIELNAVTFPGKNFQFIVGYSTSSNDIHYTWPPIELSIAGRCAAPSPDSGSILITPANAATIAEIVFRSLSALSDSSSLVDQMSRIPVDGSPNQVACGAGGNIIVDASGQAGSLEVGEQVSLSFNNCLLGAGYRISGNGNVSVVQTTGNVNSFFTNDWQYSATGTHQNLMQKRGSVPVTMSGDYTMNSSFFVGTGVQTIDLAAQDLVLDYSGTPLTLLQACSETNAFGAGNLHTESSTFLISSDQFGSLRVTTSTPLGGPFGGPAISGVVSVNGASGSKVEMDFGKCSDSALELRVFMAPGVVNEASTTCIDVGSFED